MDLVRFAKRCEVRVRRGIAYCEETDSGWLPSINLDTLNIRDNCGCVIGQRYGEYCDGLDALGVHLGSSHNWAVEHGFDLPTAFLRDNTTIDVRLAAAAILTDTWKRLIQERRDLLNLSTEPLSTETERCLATAG